MTPFHVEAHAALERARRQIVALEQQLTQAANALRAANSPQWVDADRLGDACRFYAAKLRTMADAVVRTAS